MAKLKSKLVPVNVKVPSRLHAAVLRSWPHRYESQSILTGLEAGLSVPKLCALIEEMIGAFENSGHMTDALEFTRKLCKVVAR